MKFYVSVNKLEDCTKLQVDINNALRWSIANKLTFNFSKCSVMSLTQKNETIIFDYKIDDHDLNRIFSVRDLGLHYDCKLNFAEHLEKKRAESLRALGFILRQGSNFSQIKTLKSLYFMIVRPKLEFGCVVWNPIQITQIASLEKVQNKFLRHLYFKKYHHFPDYRTVRSTRLRLEFNISSLRARRKYYSAIFIYKLYNNRINDSLCLSHCAIKVPARPMRPSFFFNIPFSSRNRCSPLVNMLKVTNEVLSAGGLDLFQKFSVFSKDLSYYLDTIST